MNKNTKICEICGRILYDNPRVARCTKGQYKKGDIIHNWQHLPEDKKYHKSVAYKIARNKQAATINKKRKEDPIYDKRMKEKLGSAAKKANKSIAEKRLQDEEYNKNFIERMRVQGKSGVQKVQEKRLDEEYNKNYIENHRIGGKKTAKMIRWKEENEEGYKESHRNNMREGWNNFKQDTERYEEWCENLGDSVKKAWDQIRERRKIDTEYAKKLWDNRSMASKNAWKMIFQKMQEDSEYADYIHNRYINISKKSKETIKIRCEEDSEYAENYKNALRNASIKRWNTIYERLKNDPEFAFEFHKKKSDLAKINNNLKPTHCTVSKVNKEFGEMLGIPFDNNKELYEFSLGSKRYDIKFNNILIEINPFPFHNCTWNPFDRYIDPDYHLNKTITAEANGYRCFHIWDWDDKNKIIKLFKSKHTPIRASKCEIKTIDETEANNFISKYHLQGALKSNQLVCYGLYYNNKLVQCMTLGKPRYNKKYEWELLRLCTDPDYKVLGGVNRLLKHFISDYNPKSIINYTDRSKFSSLYSKGFIHNWKYYSTSPSKHYYNPATESHISSNLLRAYGFDKLLGNVYGRYPGQSNEELIIKFGYVEIYDCGQLVSTYIKGNQ